GANERDMSVFGIGPAGENLVRFAAIMGDKGHAAAHNGVGAVMGSKKLKAVAAGRGKGRIAVSDRECLSQLAKGLMETMRTDEAWRVRYYTGTLDGVQRFEKSGALPIKNYTTNLWSLGANELHKFGSEYIRSHFQAKRHTCWACPTHHCHILRIPDGPYAGFVGEEPEYECFAAWGPLTGNNDVDASIVLSNEVDRLGFDTNEAGFLVSMTMECYERGILTRKDTDGLEMTWGNVPAVRILLKKIAHREGFGNVLAEGVMRAAGEIGGEAPNIGVYTMKGIVPRGHDHRTLWCHMFDTCVSDTSTVESGTRADPKMFGVPPLSSNFAAEEIARIVAAVRGIMPFEDSLGVCRFTTDSRMQRLAEFMQAATGWDYTAEEGNTSGRRFANLLRAFNVRHGHHPGLDYPSTRYGSTPVDGPGAGKSIAPEWEKMLDIYYESMGWDRRTGKPLPATLRVLGLDDLVRDVW
ncbi:MAG: aldehyde ferredoxin oxidoreductase C-terminal domain-containing protein, partial [Chloroflexota bacterium]